MVFDNLNLFGGFKVELERMSWKLRSEFGGSVEERCKNFFDNWSGSGEELSKTRIFRKFRVPLNTQLGSLKF